MGWDNPLVKHVFSILTKSVTKPSVNIDVLKQQYNFFNNFWNILQDMLVFQKTIKLWCTFPNALCKSNNVTIEDH